MNMPFLPQSFFLESLHIQKPSFLLRLFKHKGPVNLGSLSLSVYLGRGQVKKYRWMPVNEQGNERQVDRKKKQTNQEIKYRMRTDDEGWSGKCICSQAIHFPIPHPSHLLNLSPLQTRCIPQCVQLRCHFHPTRCSYLWCHWKMTKLEPRQNFLFHTPQAENCPLFLLLPLFHPAVARL